MPFTPFHFGPGLLIKTLMPAHFSLSMFALANVAMDIEPLYQLMRGAYPLHGFSHNLFGAALIGGATVLAGRIAIRRAWRWYERLSAQAGSTVHMTSTQAWMGAMTGTFSHVLLDALMHADMHPFAPFSEANPLLDISYTQNVYLGCVVAGMAGVLLMLIRAGFRPAGTH
jgi:hypothetical protein